MYGGILRHLSKQTLDGKSDDECILETPSFWMNSSPCLQYSSSSRRPLETMRSVRVFIRMPVCPFIYPFIKSNQIKRQDEQYPLRCQPMSWGKRRSHCDQNMRRLELAVFPLVIAPFPINPLNYEVYDPGIDNSTRGRNHTVIIMHDKRSFYFSRIIIPTQLNVPNATCMPRHCR